MLLPTADLQSNPGIPDLSPSLDETLNLVRPLLDPQLYHSTTLGAMPVSGPGLPSYLLLA